MPASRSRCRIVHPAGRSARTGALRASLAALAIAALGAAMLILAPAGIAFAQCPEEPPLQNFTGAGQVVCPCFIAGEEAGAVFTAPANHYPLEILRVGIGWGSQLGGSGQQVEDEIRIYPAGLPNPGTPIFTLPGPVLTDGAINEFNLEPLAGEINIASGSFTVTLKFFNSNSGDFFAPSVVHDGNGCQSGKNVVYAIPGGWLNACALGVTGDWVFYVIYRPCVVPTGIGDDTYTLSSAPALVSARPNPFGAVTELEFFLAEPGRAAISVFDVEGRRVARVVDEAFPAGTHRVSWLGRREDGQPLPTGVYFVQLQAGDYKSVKKVILAK